jgi:hypothetical protein
VSAVAIGGPATVSSSFGPVVVRDVDGRVDIRNRSGSVEAWPTARRGNCHDVALNTSFSGMEVHLPDAGYSVDARTTFGQIRADVPITATGSIGGNVVAGRIGPGGCLLRLVNTSGDIRILKAQSRTR